MEPPTPEAPPAIAVVRDFVNTTDRETGTDDLSTPADLTRYLVGHDLMPRASRATTADLDAALRLRAGLRRALELNHDGGPAALPALATALADQPVSLTWTEPGRRTDDRSSRCPGWPGTDRDRRPHRDDRGHLATPQDLRVGRVRVGVLRPLEEPVPPLVRVRLRQQGQDPRLPRPQGVGGLTARRTALARVGA